MGRSLSKGLETFVRHRKQEVYQSDCKPGIDLLGGVASKFSNNVKWLANLTLRITVIHVYTLSWTYPPPNLYLQLPSLSPGHLSSSRFHILLRVLLVYLLWFFALKNNKSLFNASHRQICVYGHPVGMDNVPRAAQPEEK